MWKLFKIIASHMIWLYVSLFVENVGAYGSYSYDGSNYDNVDYYPPDPTERYEPASKTKEQEFDRRVLINRTRPERCDKVFTLYQLLRPKEKEKSPFDLPMNHCNRPYIAIPIPNSNMLLYIGDKLCPINEEDIPLSNQPVQKDYNDTLHCVKSRRAPMYRRQLKHCFTNNTNESQIEICGKANSIQLNLLSLFLAAALVAIGSTICY
jgi:voltage-dependent calcium channel alpha-2/delta-3